MDLFPTPLAGQKMCAQTAQSGKRLWFARVWMWYLRHSIGADHEADIANM